MTDERTEVLAANEAFYRAFEKKDSQLLSPTSLRAELGKASFQ